MATLKGSANADTIIGGAGSDLLNAGSGNDYLDGGSGVDILHGDQGDDILVFRMADHGPATTGSGRTPSLDSYDGGTDVDTLRLVFTRAEWLRSDVQADVASFRALGGDFNGWFTFNSMDLRVSKVEMLQIMVDGTLIESRNLGVTLGGDEITATEDAPSVAFNLLTNDSVPNLVSTVIFSQAAHGVVTMPTLSLTSPTAPQASIVYTPNTTYYQYLAVGETAMDSFTYTVTDADGDVATSMVTVTITGANDGPLILSGTTTAALVEDAAATLTGTGTIVFSDIDLTDTHTVSVGEARTTVSGNAPAGFAPAGGFGTLTAIVNEVTTDQNAQGSLVWTFRADDAQVQRLAEGQTATQTYTLTLTDRAGSTVTRDVTVTLAGTNDAPTIAAETSAGVVVEDATTTATGTFSFGDVDIIDTHNVVVAAGGTGYLGALSATVSDASTRDGAGTIRWDFAVDNSLIQHLAAGQTLTQSYNVTVTDNNNATATRVVTITVTGTNDSPVVTSTAAAALGAVAEAGNTDVGATVTGTPSATGQLASSDVDADATATWTGTTNGIYGSFAIGATGDWSYALDNARSATQALAEGQTQTDTFTATVTDDKGATATQLVTITVTGTNDKPVLLADIDATAEDAVVAGSVATNDSDVDAGATLSFALSAPVAGLTLNGDGSYSFDASNAAYQNLAVGQTRAVVANYTVTDDKNAVSASTLTINLTGTNDAPVAFGERAIRIADDFNDGALDGWTSIPFSAAPSNWRVVSGQAYEGSDAFNGFLKKDVPADTATTFLHTVSYVLDVTITPGSTSNNDVGVVFGYTDNANYYRVRWIDFGSNYGGATHRDFALERIANGTVTTLTMVDNVELPPVFDLKIAVSPSAGVAVSVDEITMLTATGAPPLAGFGLFSRDSDVGVRFDNFSVDAYPAFQTSENAALTLTSGLLLGNDIDVDGDVLTVISASVPAGQGSVALIAGDIVFTPGSDFDTLAMGASRAVEIAYSIGDGNGGTATATAIVTISVTGTNNAPVVGMPIPDRTSPEDTAWSYTVPTGSFIDVEAASLAYSATQSGGAALPTWLTFTASTRTFSGTPPLNFNGTLDLRVTASDGSLSVTDNFVLTVAPVNDAPVVNSLLANQSLFAEGTLSYTFAANSFTDVDNATLTYSTGTLPSWLSFNAATRTFSGTPSPAQTGNTNVVVTATDAAGAAVSDTFAVTVQASAYTGTANADDYTGTAASQLILGNGGNDMLSGAGGNDTIYGDANGQSGTGNTGVGALTTAALAYYSGSNSLRTGLGGALGFGENIFARNDDNNITLTPTAGTFTAGLQTDTGTRTGASTYSSLTLSNNGYVQIGNSTFYVFANDIDTRNSAGQTSPGGNSRGTNLVYYDFDTTNHVLTVTWDDVGQFSNQTVPNAFQLQIVDRGSGDFDVLYRYEYVQWGEGTTIGYFDNNGTNYQMNGAVSTLLVDTQPGNTGVTGLYVIEVRGGRVVAAANDTIDGGPGMDTLIGGPGSDIFVFRPGETNGDTVHDFNGAGANGGDSLRFVGFGAGAAFAMTDSTHGAITYNGGLSVETITFTNAPPIIAADYIFA